MQINSYMGYNRPAYSAAASAKGKSNAFFQHMIKSASSKTASGSAGNSVTALVSPLVQYSIEYNKWRENREPLNVPGADGWTEENIQYLKNRYRGELSVFELDEALDAMKKMGCITPEEYRKAVGTKLTVCDAREATCVTGRLEDGGYSRYPWLDAPSGDFWAEALKSLPFSKANTLDELLDMLLADRKSGVF